MNRSVEIVAYGTPEEVAKVDASLTGQCLKKGNAVKSVFINRWLALCFL